ncbi:c-type cytochrome [Flavihumibacter fluvii]|uniref:c-type cytochrome n=1 Tax=Flavihumibacter fluvii TaxID=2838157 RepID=UPI001BDE3862|nr:c-type cytochrome [Flavihumibacter fluvii]ULQ50886.1 cytochrome c [Flavihumibacter fluvii]
MLKKIFKWAGVILLLFILVLSATVLMRQHLKYDAPYPSGIKASKDSAVLARGKYLVYGPAHCADCHGAAGTEDLVDKGQEVALTGGKVFDLPIGKIYPRNITSDDETGIGKLTDAQIARSLRYGVGYDGRAMFNFMPFHNTSDEDLTAIISYVRSMQPVKHKVPDHAYNLLGKVIKAFVLKPVGPDGEVLQTIQPDSTVEYGKYLATSVANCRGCHTNRDLKTGAFIGKDFSGGFQMEEKGFTFHTPNLTPDKKTGHLTGWSEEVFLQRFRKGKVYPQSPMPWGPFGRMSDTEIKAIYRYLLSVEPVDNKIAMIVEEKN